MSKKIQEPLKHELESEYNKLGSTISQLARKYNTSNPTIRKWLVQYDIQRKSHKQASIEANTRNKNSPPNKDLLYKLYKEKSLKELQNYFNVGQETIYAWLDMYGIDLKTLSEACSDAKTRKWNNITPSKEEFVEVYDLHENMYKVSEIFDLSYSSIKKLMKQYEIESKKTWRSKAEIELYERLSELSKRLTWDHSDRKTINPFELDIVCHEKKIAIEYCGLFWHSENSGEKNRNYHQSKRQKCKIKNYELITIFENDNIELVLSLIKHKLNLNNKIYARKCEIREVCSKEAKYFNDTNHLNGHCGASVHYGLYYKDELVQILSMGKSRFNKKYEWECVRMTIKKDTSVVGGASKLFKHFIKTHNPNTMITYADMRFGEGKVYEKCGFVRENDTDPTYWYFQKNNHNKIYSRVAFQKHKLKKFKHFDVNLTEWEIMKLSGYDRIWDCGNAKYIYNKP